MNEKDLPEMVKHYANELAGLHAGHAWFALVGLGPPALPHVIHAFEAQSDRSVAVDLISVVNEYRTTDALPFLSTLLGAADDRIWKTALDGIVTIGDESALTCLRAASKAAGTEKRAWVEEAISQINEEGG